MKTISIVRFGSFLLAFGMVFGAEEALGQSGPFQFHSLTPCRVVDTRNPAGTNGGPVLGTATRNFQIRGNCGVPMTARAASLNVTVTNASASSWVTIWPSGLAQPFVSTINFEPADIALANGAIVGLSTNPQDLSARNAAGTVHLIVDVTGYFE